MPLFFVHASHIFNLYFNYPRAWYVPLSLFVVLLPPKLRHDPVVLSWLMHFSGLLFNIYPVARSSAKVVISPPWWSDLAPLCVK